MSKYTPQLMDEAALKARYAELCALRDARYAEAAPLEAQLDEANARCEAARLEAEALARRVEAVWGDDWLTLKREIAQLSKLLAKGR